MAGMGSRLFSTSAINGVHESGRIAKPSLLAREVVDTFVRARPAVEVFRVRQYSSTVTLQGETEKEKNKEEEEKKVQNVNTTAGSEKEKGNIVSYWGVPPSKVASKDGTDWKWTCFRVSTSSSLSLVSFSFLFCPCPLIRYRSFRVFDYFLASLASHGSLMSEVLNAKTHRSRNIINQVFIRVLLCSFVLFCLFFIF